jgi:dCMP deaminase
MNFDDYYMNMAYLVSMKSKDESTHIGAVVVGSDNEVRSVGYNSFPRGILDNLPERQIRPEKYYWFEHAERNAVYNATLLGTSLKGCRMYTNGIPCMDCARAVVQAGIKEVIIDKKWDDNNDDIWIENAKRTKVLFGEAEVKIRYWEGELVCIQRFKRGKVFE